MATTNHSAQWLILLDWFLSHPGEEITGRQIEDDLGIMNYKGRVFDVRKNGYPVERHWREVPNRYGGMSKIAVYSLSESFVRLLQL